MCKVPKATDALTRKAPRGTSKAAGLDDASEDGKEVEIEHGRHQHSVCGRIIVAPRATF